MQNKLFEKNINFIQRNLAGLAGQMEGLKPGEKYEAVPAKEPGLCCVIQREGERTLPLYSKYNPRQEAELWAANQDLAGKRYVVMFGLGLGYHVEALLSRYPGLTFFIYEPDGSLFLRTMECRDWTIFPWSSVRYVILENGAGKHNAFIRQVLIAAKGDWSFVSIPSFERCFPHALYKFREDLIYQKEQYVLNLVSSLMYDKDWTINAVKNLPYLINYSSIFRYKDNFKGKTVVMTASGPSLKDALPYLKKIKEDSKALIVAAGSSINGLLNYGIEPDLFVSYDPIIDNYNILKPSLDKGIPFVFGSTVNHEMVKFHVGPKAHFILNQDAVFNHFVGGLNPWEVVADAPSVTVVTVELLNKLEVSNLILVGQDLAFYQDLYYAEGISYQRQDSAATEQEKADYIAIMANNGNMVYSNKGFDVMRQHLERALNEAKFEKVFNTSPFGAQIRGAYYLEWEQVINSLENQHVEGEIVFDSPGTGANTKKIKKKLEKFIQVTNNELVKVIFEIDKLAEDSGINDGAFDTMFVNVFKKLKRINSTGEFKAIIFPMIKNENHFLAKVLIDTSKLSIAEKKEIVQKELKTYVQGIQVSLNRLKDVLGEWEMPVGQEVS